MKTEMEGVYMRMITVKRLILRIALLAEMCAFGYIYVYGKNGLQSLQQQRFIVGELEKNIAKINDEVTLLEKEIYAWQTDDFYKEKVAREQLQMARKGDELFYIG